MAAPVLTAGMVALGTTGAVAQEAAQVVVFEGVGLGHGVGLPLDGANHLARDEAASPEEILEHFYPETDLGSADGLVRFLVATRDDVRAGFDIRLPDGGVLRDGRTTPVAPSFPVRVPSDSTVRITVDDGFYRAEVLDDRSVSGTQELTPTSTAGTSSGQNTDPPADDTEATTTTAPAASTTAPSTTTTVPALAASPNSLWVEPRDGGALVVGRTEANGEIQTGGLHEVVLEAERLHLVGETDVETYLSGLSFMLDDETGLEPAALEAAVIAARSYALRAAASEARVGRFHLFADERSFPFVGIGNATDDHEQAVAATAGRVLRHQGELAAAMVSTSAGGVTAALDEVFTGVEDAPPYLRSVEYATGQEFRWRAEVALAVVAARLGYEGDPASVAVNETGPSGRAIELVVSGDDGPMTVDASTFGSALRLPSSRFRVTIEERAEAVPARDDSPPFQELPGTPVDGDVAALATPTDAGDGGIDLPPNYVLGPLAALALATVLSGTSRLLRRRERRREKRAPRSREAPRAPAPAPTLPEPEPDPETEPDPAETSDEVKPERARPAVDGPTWHNEPEWLRELMGEDDAPELDVEDVDEHTLRRSIERMRQKAETERDRPLREVLGWDDAPEWLDEERSAPESEDDDPHSGR